MNLMNAPCEKTWIMQRCLEARTGARNTMREGVSKDVVSVEAPLCWFCAMSAPTFVSDSLAIA